MFKPPVVDHSAGLPKNDLPHAYNCKCFSIIIQLIPAKFVVNMLFFAHWQIKQGFPKADTCTLPFYAFSRTTCCMGRYQKRDLPTHTRNMLWESIIMLDFMRRVEDNRIKCTNQSGWTPPHLDHRCPHLHHRLNFMPYAFPAITLPIYPGLGQASNMLDGIPGGLVAYLELIPTYKTYTYGTYRWVKK